MAAPLNEGRKMCYLKPINLLSYLLSTNSKRHAPHDAKCKVRHKSYPGSYQLPKTDRKKERAYKSKSQGQRRRAWSRDIVEGRWQGPAISDKEL